MSSKHIVGQEITIRPHTQPSPAQRMWNSLRVHDWNTPYSFNCESKRCCKTAPEAQSCKMTEIIHACTRIRFSSSIPLFSLFVWLWQMWRGLVGVSAKRLLQPHDWTCTVDLGLILNSLHGPKKEKKKSGGIFHQNCRSNRLFWCDSELFGATHLPCEGLKLTYSVFHRICSWGKGV